MLKKIMTFVFVFVLSISTLNIQVNARGFAKNQRISNVNTNLPTSTWLWNTDMILTNSTNIINYLKTNNINELYLQIDTSLQSDAYKNFISLASKNQIKVYALDGNPTWIYEEKAQGLKDFFKWVENYNNSVIDSQKFNGIHLDVEPYLVDEWSIDRDKIVLYYQNYLTYARNEATRMNSTLNVDIPFWFDEINYTNVYGQGNLSRWIIETTDSVNIMAYRDKAVGEGNIIDIVKTEVEWANQLNKKLVISVEIGKSYEANYVSFYEEGITEMYNELNKVNFYYSSLEYKVNFAVHDLRTLMNMKR